ncbi:MAG: DUF2267 domain-containing protein, partial [Burkholderiaceae bacterium]
RDAYHAMHAVLGALRDRLPPEVAVNLSSHMPLFVRGIFFDGFEPARTPLRSRAVEQFVADVLGSLTATPHIDAEQAINAVLDTLTHHIDRGVFATMHHVLPPQLRAYLALPSRGAPSRTNETSLTAEA